MTEISVATPRGTRLSQLHDTQIYDPDEAQLVVYDRTLGKWVNKAVDTVGDGRYLKRTGPDSFTGTLSLVNASDATRSATLHSGNDLDYGYATELRARHVHASGDVLVKLAGGSPTTSFDGDLLLYAKQLYWNNKLIINSNKYLSADNIGGVLSRGTTRTTDLTLSTSYQSVMSVPLAAGFEWLVAVQCDVECISDAGQTFIGALYDLGTASYVGHQMIYKPNANDRLTQLYVAQFSSAAATTLEWHHRKGGGTGTSRLRGMHTVMHAYPMRRL